MTTRELLWILRRRWYVVIAGAACTVLAFMLLSDSQRVYWTQTDVVFEAPGTPAVAGFNSGLSETLTNFAGIVLQKVTDGEDSLTLSSPTATLYGAGVHEGKSISLADRGGQWVHVFDRPVLSIQVVDSSPERVAAVMNDVITKIAVTTDSLQQASGAAADQRITITRAPETLEVVSFGQTTTSKVKGLAALSLVGAGLTAAAASLWDRAARRRRAPAEQAVSHVG